MGVDYLVGLASRLGQWGYLLVFVGAMLESAAMVGVLVPGEALVLAAGFFAARHVFDLDALIVAVAIGATVGDSLGYELGRRWGRDALVRYGWRFGITTERLARVARFFTRHGGASVFLGRFVGFARALVPFLAGSARMPYARFLAYNAAGATLWSAAVVLLGYFVGTSWHAAEAWIGRLTAMLAALVGLAILFRMRARLRAFVPWDIAVVVVAVCLFGAIAEDVVNTDPLTVLDVQLAHWWATHRIDALTPVLLAVTRLHNPIELSFIGLLAGVVLLLRHEMRWFTSLVATVGGGALLNDVLKHVFHRIRPDVDHAGLLFSSFSFPSGHVSTATLLYGFGAAYAVAHVSGIGKRAAFVAGALLMVVLVAVTRMYFGAHYLSDVLAAFVEGAAWLALCLMVFHGRMAGWTWRRFEQRHGASPG